MTSDYGYLDMIYNQMCKNKRLMELLGNPKSAKERNEKIHRTITPLEYATTEKVNFLSIYFSSTTETDNDYVVRGFFMVDYYARNRGDMSEMLRVVREIMADNDIRYQSSHAISSDTKGIYRWRDVYRPLLFN